MRRIGIGFGRGHFLVREIVEYAKLAEKSGFESVWMTEHLFSRDAFSLLVMVALETKKVRLSTAVVNIYSRNPVQMAMNVATLNELSNNRAMLGIGTGNTTLLWKIGVKAKNHLSAIRDYTTIVRGLLAGKMVTHKGNVFHVQGVKLEIELSSKGVSIYLAAVRPEMLQLAGEIGDGVIFSSLSSCEYVGNALEDIRIGAERAGKKLRDIDVSCLISTFVSEDSLAAKAAAKEFVLRSFSYPGVFSDSRVWEMIFGQEQRDSLSLVKESLKKGDMKTASRHMTGEMVDLVTIAGRPDECEKKLNKFVSAGVTLPIVMPISDPLATITTFSQT